MLSQVMPLYHIHAISINLLASLVSGASCVAAPGPQPELFLGEWLHASPAPTWYSAVPTVHGLLVRAAKAMDLDQPGAISHELAFARSESSMLPLPVGQALESIFGIHVSQTYAMTEAMPIAANPIGSARKLQSVGPAAGSEIQICDGAGKPLACGVEGEVCVRGACVTVGYELRIHMREDPNHAAFHADANTTTRPDGSGVWIGYNPARAWLRTGDKGYVDGDTHVHLVGRFKEIINRGGEKISPFEIEHVLRAHAGVDDMIVFAVPHAQLGEVVGVAVVPRFPCFLTLEELRTFGVSEGLAPKWLPEALVLIQSVPKGATGKPARIGLATRLGIPELSVAGDATTRHGNDASEGGGSGSGSGASAYDSLALPGTRRGGTHATGAAYPNAHISGIVFVVVESVLLFHFCPRLSLRSSLYLLDICTWLSSHFGGMSLLFIASGLTTHLTHAKDDPAASCSAYGAFLWGRTQRLLLVAYAAQWSMLIAATQHPPSPPLGLGELDEYIFDARPLALSILLPTTLLYEPISSVLYDVNPGNTIYLSLEESFSLNAPAWFVGNLFVFWFAYPLASRCLRLIERQAGSVGLFAVTACLLILAAIAFKVVDYTEYVWHNAPLFFAGSTLAALATRHDALAEALQKKADDPVTGSTSTFDCAWSWACAHQTMLRGALADVTVVAVVLKTAYGFAYAPQRELNAEVTNWETAWWHSLSVLLFLIFLYGSCADGGAGLVARVMRHPLLLKLGDYSMALYMWQQLWFLGARPPSNRATCPGLSGRSWSLSLVSPVLAADPCLIGVFQIPYAHVTLPMGVRAEAQGTQAVIYNHILPGTNTTPPLLVGENVADLPARLDAIRFVAALLGIHAFAVVYVEWLEVPLLSARWLGEKAWWRRILL